MRIEIKCFATLSEFSPKDGVLELAEGTTAQDVLTQLAIPVEEVKLIFVNGIHAPAETVLNNGDRVGFFPAVGGG